MTVAAAERWLAGRRPACAIGPLAAGTEAPGETRHCRCPGRAEWWIERDKIGWDWVMVFIGDAGRAARAECRSVLR